MRDTARRPAPRVPNGVTGCVGGAYRHGHSMRTEDLFPFSVLCLVSSWPCGPRASLSKLACLSGHATVSVYSCIYRAMVPCLFMTIINQHHIPLYFHLQYQLATSFKLSEYLHHRGDSHLPSHILHLRSGFGTPARNVNQGLIWHPSSTICHPSSAIYHPSSTICRHVYSRAIILEVRTSHLQPPPPTEN